MTQLNAFIVWQVPQQWARRRSQNRTLVHPFTVFFARLLYWHSSTVVWCHEIPFNWFTWHFFAEFTKIRWSWRWNIKCCSLDFLLIDIKWRDLFNNQDIDFCWSRNKIFYVFGNSRLFLGGFFGNYFCKASGVRQPAFFMWFQILRVFFIERCWWHQWCESFE